MTAVDGCQPRPGRAYGYWLGSDDWSTADQDQAARLEAAYPGFPGLAAENREFVTKAARWLAALSGISRFLDLGCGPVVRPMIHETVQLAGVDPLAVYADSDPLIVSHVARHLDGVKDAAVIEADLADVAGVLGQPPVQWLTAAGEPVAVIFGAVLGWLDDAAARAVVAGYMGALPAGSAAVISLASFEDPATAAAVAAASGAPRWNHSAEDVTGWFEAAGLRIVRGRVAGLEHWPMLTEDRRPARVIGGVGVKPSLLPAGC